MSIWLGRIIAAAAIGITSSLGAQAQTSLSPEELRTAAVVALKAGNAPQARGFAEALLTRDENDLNAHLILARSARDMGDIAPARAAADRAWQLAETDEDRFSAALIKAQVLSTDGKRTRAQLWLRRAAQHAPNEALREKAKGDFRYVKQRNPWQTDLSFTLAPNSNINNGSAQDRSQLNYVLSEILFGQPVEYQLNDVAQAISGIEFGGSLRTRYRFHETSTTAHDAKLSLAYRSFTITDDLSDTSVKGSDFAFGSLALGYGFRNLNMEGKGELTLDLEAGQTWYSGTRYASYLRAQTQQSWRRKADQQLRFGAELERLQGQATPDVDTFGVSASLTQGFASGNSGFVGLYLTAAQSVDPGSEYAEVMLRTGFALKKPVLGAAVQFGLGTSWRNYDVSRDSRDGRQDNRIFADVTAVFKEIDYYGFNPSVSLSASTTDSNVGLYNVNRVGLNIGIKSAF